MSGPHWLNGLFACIDRKDTAGFVAYLTDDVRFRFGNAPVVQGHEAVTAAVQGFFDALGSLAHSLSQTWCDGDAVICHGIVTYTRLDGSRLTVPFANVFTLQGERIDEYLIFIDQSALFAGS